MAKSTNSMAMRLQLRSCAMAQLAASSLEVLRKLSISRNQTEAQGMVKAQGTSDGAGAKSVAWINSEFYGLW